MTDINLLGVLLRRRTEACERAGPGGRLARTRVKNDCAQTLTLPQGSRATVELEMKAAAAATDWQQT